MGKQPQQIDQAFLDIVQGDIDTVLAYSRRALAVLPGETWEQEHHFWHTMSLGEEVPFSGKGAYTRFKLDNESNLLRRARSQTGETLEAYFADKIPDHRHPYDPEHRSYCSPKQMKFTFNCVASAAELRAFEENQTHLLSGFIERLTKARTKDIFTVEETYNDPQLGIFDTARILSFVQAHPETFSHLDNLSGVNNYIPELGFALGSDEEVIAEIIGKIAHQGTRLFEGAGGAAFKYGHYDLSDKDVFTLIGRYPERFKESESMREVLFFVDKIQEGLDQAWVESARDLGSFLAKQMRDEFNLDLMPGRLSQIAYFAYDRDDERSIKDQLKAKKTGIPRVPVTPLPARNIRVSNNITAGVSEIMSEATGMRDRKVARETGGKAGWGARRPDLWKPENK